jgi:hypothetical protein
VAASGLSNATKILPTNSSAGREGSLPPRGGSGHQRPALGRRDRRRSPPPPLSAHIPGTSPHGQSEGTTRKPAGGCQPLPTTKIPGSESFRPADNGSKACPADEVYNRSQPVPPESQHKHKNLRGAQSLHAVCRQHAIQSSRSLDKESNPNAKIRVRRRTKGRGVTCTGAHFGQLAPKKLVCGDWAVHMCKVDLFPPTCRPFPNLGGCGRGMKTASTSPNLAHSSLVSSCTEFKRISRGHEIKGEYGTH